MSELMNFSEEKTFSSLYLVEQINLFREQEGNRAVLQHSDFLKKLRIEFEEELNEGIISYRLITKELAHNSTQIKCYELNFDQSLQMLMSESRTVRKQVVQILKAQQDEIRKLSAPQTYKQALLALIAAEEEKELLALQNDNLSTALDSLVDWVSIIKVAQFNKVSEKMFNWRELKSASEDMGFAIKKAESPRYGYQNLYNINVFKKCYPSLKYDILKSFNVDYNLKKLK